MAHTGVVYTRSVGGKEIELRVSGKLYKDALVMFDRETGTLWTQVDGKALRGPLAGRRLVEVPALQTTWKAWKKLHPDTLVLQKPPSIRGSSYEGYFSDPERRGLSGTRGDPRLPGKTLIIGVHDGDDAAAIPLDTLEKKQLIEVALADRPVVVVYSRKEQTAAVFRASVKDRRLSFNLRRQGSQVFLGRRNPFAVVAARRTRCGRATQGCAARASRLPAQLLVRVVGLPAPDAHCPPTMKMRLRSPADALAAGSLGRN